MLQRHIRMNEAMQTERIQGKRSFIRVLCILCILCFTRVGASAQSADQQQIEKGKQVMGQACTQCHGIRYMQVQRKSREQWKNAVYAMISTGALVMPDEIDPLVAYLAATYGPNSPATPISGGNRDSGMDAGTGLPEGPAKILVVENCQTCHSLQTATAKARTRAEWNEVIGRMVKIGAKLNEAEQTKVIDYLSALGQPNRSE
jgi:cytochrome c5